MNLILASKSPRRQELLKNAGFQFEIRTKDTPEDYPTDLPLAEVPIYLAEKKARAFADELTDNELLIASDTVVILGNEIIGKPLDLTDAKQMLLKLSGQCHLVITGVCLWSSTQKITFSETTWVYFKVLTDQEIDYYLQTAPPLDKAGSYGIQDWLGLIGVRRIEGDFYNVMGLPVARLYDELEKLGFSQLV
jgi:septum formation protein